MSRPLPGASRLAGLAESTQRGIHLVAYALATRDPLLLDLEVHLFAEHGDVTRSLDSDPHLLPHDRQHGDLNVVTDHDALVGLARQYQHGNGLPACLMVVRRKSGPVPSLATAGPLADASIPPALALAQATATA